MPFANIKITSTPKASTEQKAELIARVTDAIADVLDKDPESTFVVIEEVQTEAWGVGGETASVRRARAAQDAES